MSARMAVMAARAAGVQILVDAGDLVLEAAAPPRPSVLEQLSRHKAAIVSMLRPGADGWSAEDWQAYFDERAGIAEFDGNLPRHRAEAQATESCTAEWVRRNGGDVAQAGRQCQPHQGWGVHRSRPQAAPPAALGFHWLKP